MEDINKLRDVLSEKRVTNRWLANKLGVTPSTVSKWCTNSSQPSLEPLIQISDVLEIDYTELIRAERRIEKRLCFVVEQILEKSYDNQR